MPRNNARKKTRIEIKSFWKTNEDAKRKKKARLFLILYTSKDRVKMFRDVYEIFKFPFPLPTKFVI